MAQYNAIVNQDQEDLTSSVLPSSFMRRIPFRCNPNGLTII